MEFYTFHSHAHLLGFLTTVGDVMVEGVRNCFMVGYVESYPDFLKDVLSLPPS